MMGWKGGDGMSIGERIKQRRSEKGWSLRDLAEKMGYANHSTIARIETGDIDIPQSRVVQFADVLGVSVAYLMGWDEDPEEMASLTARILQDADLLQMVNEYLSLGAGDRGVIRAMTHAMAQKKEG